jgi:hypothetical protein
MKTMKESIKVISEQLNAIMEEQLNRIVTIDNQISQAKVGIYSAKTTPKQKDELLDKYIELAEERDGLFTPFQEVQNLLHSKMQMLENMKWSKLYRWIAHREIDKIEKYIVNCADKIIESASEIDNPQEISTIKEAIKEMQEEREAKKEKVSK